VIDGTLIMESLRAGTDLRGLNLTVRQISKYRASGTTAGQPDVWTVLEFGAEEGDGPALAEAFAGVLDQPAWYVNFQSPTESFIVYPGRIFRYPRGDAAGRAEAQDYGRKAGIPEPQLDWTA
jgi:hypothetical protein